MKVRCIKNVEGIDNEFAFIEGEIYKAILIDNNLKITGESNYMWSLFKDEVFNEHFEYIKAKKDKIVKQVTDKFKARSKVGIEKYGTTLEENNTDDFLEHLQCELMDATLYIQKLKSQSIDLTSISTDDLAIELSKRGCRITQVHYSEL